MITGSGLSYGAFEKVENNAENRGGLSFGGAPSLEYYGTLNDFVFVGSIFCIFGDWRVSGTFCAHKILHLRVV